MIEKTCSQCKQPKALKDFGRTQRSKDGHHSECRECHRKRSREWYARNRKRCQQKKAAWAARNPDKTRQIKQRYRERHPDRLKDARLRCKYGLSLEAYKKMADDQQDVCAICHETETQPGGLVVDHDHETGRVRALLCRRCNVILGMVAELPELLDSLRSYLEAQHVLR